MGKIIGRIYIYNQHNWPYPSPYSDFVLPQHSEPPIQTQRIYGYLDSVGAHALAYSVSYQSTSYRGNTDVNNNDVSHSFQTPSKNNHSHLFFGGTITTTTTPNSSKLPPHGKKYLCF